MKNRDKDVVNNRNECISISKIFLTSCEKIKPGKFPGSRNFSGETLLLI